MRRGLAICAMVMVGATAGLIAAAEGGGPTLTVEHARIDLGEIKAGTDAVATFVFRNSGASDVRILRAKPS